MNIFILFKKSLVFTIIMTILTGIVYPAAVTGLAQAVFPYEANGSIVFNGSRPAASEMVGQYFKDYMYFWSRPSMTYPYPYNAARSAGSNQSPAGDEMDNLIKERIKLLAQADPENKDKIPVDLITASGSGLDPHITPAAAQYQIPRVARCRNLDPGIVRELVEKCTEEKLIGIFGESRVNVVKLNMELNRLKQK